MRIGLLSTARINAAITWAAGRLDDVEVVAVASRDLARARAQAAQLGVPGAHGSYEALLADPDVDAVYVSLPNGLHVDWSVRALQAGKHVLCEKPLTASPGDAERAFAAAEQAGRVLTEGLMWRHLPQTARLMELLPQVGELRLVRAHFSFSSVAPDDPRLRVALEGGALMDVGCYCLSAMRLVAGEPEAAAGFAVRAGDGVDVRTTAALRFPGGVLGHLDCAMDLPKRHVLEVAGSDGALLLRDPWHGATHPGIELRRPDGTVEHVETEVADPYARQLSDFADAARHGRPPLLGRDDALGQARGLALVRAGTAA